MWRTTGNAWYAVNNQRIQRLRKYSDLAMFHESPRGRNAGTIGGSRVAKWLGQTMSGPVRGTFSTPSTVNKPTR